MGRIGKIMALVLGVSLLFYFLPVTASSAEAEPWKEVCNRFAKLMAAPGLVEMGEMGLKIPGDSSYLEQRRMAAIEAVKALLLVYTLDRRSRAMAQVCMLHHDPSVNLMDGHALLLLIWSLLKETGVHPQTIEAKEWQPALKETGFVSIEQVQNLK